MGDRYREYLTSPALYARNERLVRAIRANVNKPYNRVLYGRERLERAKGRVRSMSISEYYRKKFGGG